MKEGMALLTYQQLKSELLAELAQTALVYQTVYTPKELELLAELFADGLADESYDWPTVARAFMRHRKTCKRFPTLAHIVELLPECYRRPASASVALPEVTGASGPRVNRHEQFLAWKARRDTHLAGVNTVVKNVIQELANGSCAPCGN